MIQLNQTEVLLAEDYKNHFKQTVINVINYCRKNNDTGFVTTMMASGRMEKSFGENLIKIIEDPKLKYEFVNK